MIKARASGSSAKESSMKTLARDHAGLDVLPYADCLRLLAKAPLGRISFMSDGDVVIMPVNHGLDGTSVVFRTAGGSKLRVASDAGVVAFEIDGYDWETISGFSVLVTGRAEQVLDDAEIARLEQLDVRPGLVGAERPFWMRIRADGITGRTFG
jgi:uncharacterized protein